MATVTVPTKVVRSRQPFASLTSSKRGKWSKWHMVIRVGEPRKSPWHNTEEEHTTHWTRCNHFYELGENLEGDPLVEVSTLDQVKAEDLCGKCFYGLLLGD